MPNKSKIVLFTSGFPYGFGESFLETEILFLSAAFDEIIIIPKNPKQLDTSRMLPPNCRVKPLYFEGKKLGALKYFFQWEVIQEAIKVIFSTKGYNKLKILVDQIFIAYHSISILEKVSHTKEKQIVYSYWTDDSAIGFGLIKNKYPNGHFVSRAHGWDVYFERHSDNYLPLRPFLSSRLDNIFFISNNGLQYFQCIPGVYAGFGSLSRLGTKNPNETRNTPPETSLQIISCSSLIPLKRIHLIIEALSLIQIPFHWYHIGDGPLKEPIHKLAKEKLKKEDYTFLGQLSNIEVFNFYLNKSLNLLINVSSTEGIPVSMMEALSFGIACVGTNVGGVSEIINEDKSGYLLQANPSPNEIASILNKYYYQSIKEKKSLSNSAYEFWKQHFNATHNYLKFIDALKQLS